MKNTLLVFIIFLLPQIASAQELTSEYEDDIIGDSLLMRSIDSLSIYYESIGYYEHALEELNRLPELTLSQSRRKASLCFKLEDLDTSENIILNDILPKDTLFANLNLLAMLYFKQMDIKNAIYYRELLADKYPYNSSNIILLSSLYELDDALPLASKYLDNYLLKYPSNLSVRRQRAFNNFKMGETQNAHVDLALLYELGDENPNSLYYYGNVLMNTDSIPKAEIVLEKGVVSTDYKNPIMMLDYAYVLNKQQQYSKADDILNMVDSLLNQTPEFLFNNYTLNGIKGNVYLAQKKMAAAAKSFEKALSYRPDSEITLYSLIMIENNLGRKERLKKWTNRYLQVVSKIPSEDKSPELRLREKRISNKRDDLVEEAFMSR